MLGHIPVLLSEVLRTFQLQPGQNVIDATLGAGGHAGSMLARIAPTGRLLGIEADPRTLESTRVALAAHGDRAVFVRGNFRQLEALARTNRFDHVDAILFDLGLSSMSVDDPTRGFSFQANGPLDMRFDPSSQTLTAADLVNNGTAEDLATIFRAYGQEPGAARVAAAIVARRQQARFADTADLAALVASVVRRRGPRHPATKIFQALRMAVNDELGALTDALPQAFELLAPSGTLGVISFHSGEDRIVKRFMRETAQAGRGTLLTKHVIKPARAEQLSNPRSRSAVFRAISKSHSLPS